MANARICDTITKLAPFTLGTRYNILLQILDTHATFVAVTTPSNTQ